MKANSEPDRREALAERLIEDVTRSLETLSVYLGIKLRLYQGLADLGAATEADLAAHTAIAPRYAREWLEQQAAAGYVTCEDPAQPPAQRRYLLPGGHAEVLLDESSPYHAAPGVVMFGGLTALLHRVADAFRTGTGVPYAAYGDDIRRGIAAFNRPMFQHELSHWLAAMPDTDRRLRSAPPARVLDVGCGLGTACITLAQEYPRAVVHGVDLDEKSITEARTAAAAAGVADRVTFATGDAAHHQAHTYDLITFFETLHDLADPVAALRAARSALREGGCVLVADERVDDQFTAPASVVERFQYGWSVLHCLPATLATGTAEANGTVLRAPTVARWARDAGFGRFDVLPIDNDFWRFYRFRR